MKDKVLSGDLKGIKRRSTIQRGTQRLRHNFALGIQHKYSMKSYHDFQIIFK